jgi:hypothetical protein
VEKLKKFADEILVCFDQIIIDDRMDQQQKKERITLIEDVISAKIDKYKGEAAHSEAIEKLGRTYLLI